MLRSRTLYVSLQQQTHHMLNLIANKVSHHADHAVAAHGHNQECLIIIPTPDFELRSGTADDAGYLVHVSAGFFGANDIVNLAQANRSLISHVHAGAAHDVIDDAGQVRLARNRLEVLIDTFLWRFVVIGHNQQQAIDALSLGFLAEFNALCGAVSASAGNDSALVAH